MNTCILLFVISVVAVMAVDVFTTISVRSIYYFMLFPLAAIVITSIYAICDKKAVYASLLTVAAILGSVRLVPYLSAEQTSSNMDEIVEYLQKEGITTVYSRWNLADKIAIASDFSIDAYFWDSNEDVFEPVRYLCDPSKIDAEPENCAYIFKGEGAVEIAEFKLQSEDISLVFLNYFPDEDIYVFMCTENLMQYAFIN